jgi:hypothetical protein
MQKNKITADVSGVVLKKTPFPDNKDNEVEIINDEAPVAFTIPLHEKPRFIKETLLHCRRISHCTFNPHILKQ